MTKKNIGNVRGYRISCLSFEACPMCYGCRAYRQDDSECLICKEEDEKSNLCKTHIHKSYLVDKMITKNIIDLDLTGGFDCHQ